MKDKFKRISIALIGFVVMSVVSYFVINWFFQENNKLVSLNTNTSKLVETKTTYYVGESFEPSATYVNLVYFDKGENTEWTLRDYALTRLSSKISDIKYEISGFDSSKVTDSQTVNITVSSQIYSGEVSTKLNIKILPERIVKTEIIDSGICLKENFVVNEVLNYENLQIKNTYSNGKTEFFDVTPDMVNGFDTSVVSTKRKVLKITLNDITISHNYAVVPNEDYILFYEEFVQCFVPSTVAGFEALNPEINIFEFNNDEVASIELGYYDKFSYTEEDIIDLYNTGTAEDPDVAIINSKNTNQNGIALTIYELKFDYSPIVVTAVYFNNFFVNSDYEVFDVTVEILFFDYAENTESAEIFETLLNSITI